MLQECRFEVMVMLISHSGCKLPRTFARPKSLPVTAVTRRTSSQKGVSDTRAASLNREKTPALLHSHPKVNIAVTAVTSTPDALSNIFKCRTRLWLQFNC